MFFKSWSERNANLVTISRLVNEFSARISKPSEPVPIKMRLATAADQKYTAEIIPHRRHLTNDDDSLQKECSMELGQ